MRKICMRVWNRYAHVYVYAGTARKVLVMSTVFRITVLLKDEGHGEQRT